MRLGDLMARLPASAQRSGPGDPEIAAIEIDSRAVRSGALFVALRGTATDGHRYVDQAIANGAAAVVVDEAHALRHASVAIVHVPDTRRALSTLAAAFYGDPSHALDVLGVTGTNGKTTVTRMIAAILTHAGRACGVIGTVGADLGSRHYDLQNTTPLPPELHRLLAEMREGGARAVAMEISSHALALERVEDVRVRVGVLTNITRDHLDFHGTLDAYATAKRHLFTLARAGVLNASDPFGQRWHEAIAARIPVLTYAIDAPADLVASNIMLEPGRSHFELDGVRVEVPLPGRFNIENALAAIAAVRHIGIDATTAARGLASLERVPGRMEHMSGGGVNAVVDYAHTPDALAKTLQALRETTSGRIAVVFGCGGDRDRGKRPEMGRIAAEFADAVYVTSDNPRSEDPSAIAADIVRGIGSHAYTLELDRRRAIDRAVADASPGDTVLIAGKGHERYQIVGTHVLEFDDAEAARTALAARGTRA